MYYMSHTMIKFQNMGLQKVVILGDLGDWNFYVIKCFPIDTKSIVRIQNLLNF